MTDGGVTRIFVPQDAAALAVGAERVARALRDEAARRGAVLQIVRTGSRGAVWLEPLIEVETAAGRIGYGPVTAGDVAGLFEAGFLTGGIHALRIGQPEAHPWFAGQMRLTFAKCGIIDPVSVDDYRAHGGFEGLTRARGMGGAAIVDMVKAFRAARAWRRGVPDRHQVEHGAARGGRPQIHRLQCRRGR